MCVCVSEKVKRTCIHIYYCLTSPHFHIKLIRVKSFSHFFVFLTYLLKHLKQDILIFPFNEH